MTSIQNHPRFKKDIERYNSALKDCRDNTLKLEIKSLIDQFLETVKQLDQNLNLLVSERLLNKTQQQEANAKLADIRAKLESKISAAESK